MTLILTFVYRLGPLRDALAETATRLGGWMRGAGFEIGPATARAAQGAIDESRPARRLAVRTIVVVGALASIWLLLTLILPAAGYALNPFLTPSLRYAHERQSGIELIDRHGIWLGVLPPTQFADFSDGRVLREDHVTVPAVRLHPVFRRCLVMLEDQGYDGGVSRSLGTDVFAAASALWHTVRRQKAHGASTLLMMASRMLENRVPGRHEPWSVKVHRKLAEMVNAGAIVDILDSGDPEAADRFIASHLPLVYGSANSGFGPSLYGTTVAARVLWGKAAEDMTTEEAAILAAAVNINVMLPPPDDSAARPHAERVWQRVRQRADYCLGKAFAHDDQEIAAARARLARMAIPEPHLDPRIAHLLPRDPRTRWKILVNPVRRAQWLASQELSALKADLDETYGARWRGRLLSARLTTSAVENVPFAEAVQSALVATQRDLADRLSLKLVGTDAGSAHVVAVVLDPQARIRRFYNSHHAVFQNQQGMLGSIAKMWAAIALGERDSPTASYCAAPRACATRFPATTAFARSMRDPLLAATYRLSEQRVRELVASFGLKIPGDAPARTAVVDGIVEATPRALVAAILALGLGVAGEQPVIARPGLIQEVVAIEEATAPPSDLDRIAPGAGGAPLAARFSPRQRAYVSAVLSAPAKPGGTLAGLALHARGADLLLAKTGTVARNKQTYAVLIAGVVLRQGKPWTFLVWVSAPDAKRPLGSEILAARFVKVAIVALRAALEADIEQPPAAQGRKP